MDYGLKTGTSLHMYLTSNCLIISEFGLFWCAATLFGSEAANVWRWLLVGKKKQEKEKKKEEEEEEDTIIL